MICKICGKLVTTKNQCLCCGSSQKGTSSVKLTPKQIAEYELASKQREAEALKAEQDRIKAEQERVAKIKTKTAKILSFVGIGLTVLALLLVIFKNTSLNAICVFNYAQQYNTSYTFGIVSFFFAMAAALCLIITAVFKKQCGKKIILWIVLAVVALPIGFVGAVGAPPPSGTLSVTGVKEEYYVGEELELNDLVFNVTWDNGNEDTFYANEFEVVFLDNEDDEQATEFDKLYVIGFDTSTSTSLSVYKMRVEFKIVIDRYTQTDGYVHTTALTYFCGYEVI